MSQTLHNGDTITRRFAGQLIAQRDLVQKHVQFHARGESVPEMTEKGALLVDGDWSAVVHSGLIAELYPVIMEFVRNRRIGFGKLGQIAATDVQLPFEKDKHPGPRLLTLRGKSAERSYYIQQAARDDVSSESLMDLYGAEAYPLENHWHTGSWFMDGNSAVFHLACRSLLIEVLELLHHEAQDRQDYYGRSHKKT